MSSKTLDQIANIVGIDRSDVQKIWRKARENNKRIESCSRHVFPADSVRLGVKYRCLNCRGEMDAVSVKYYIEGYMAAGGNPDVIWPGWEYVR